MTEPLTIHDLVKQSGEMPRTIHYYIKEGLLPPPEGRGSKARYDPGCVLRLRLIRLLQQKRYMRLEGIREFMAPLTDDALQFEIDRLEGGAPLRGPDLRALAIRSRVATLDVMDEDEPLALSADALGDEIGAGRAEDADKKVDADTWTRVRISDDVEIHFRDGSRASRAEQLRRLIQLARQLFRRR